MSERWVEGQGAHPRSRGENVLEEIGGDAVKGSSPLTRGKPRRDRDRRLHRGLIPAHAGKTSHILRTGNNHWAHPRSRGENLNAGSASTAAAGSSPLTRGKRAEADALPDGAGLIPAHAGKTRQRRPTGRSCPAHPRSRGENNADAWFAVSAGGSSPLTRGKLVDHLEHLHCGGLIPAHAGKTPSRRRARPSRRAHPRSRGENAVQSACAPALMGSSPLTRGKRHHQHGLGSPRGLIPAHAGKTGLVSSGGARVGAHPRSRGENAVLWVFIRADGGSSPLTRGKL